MEINERIEKMINSSKVFLFMKGSPQLPQCGFSAKVVQVLNELGVEYDSFDVYSDNLMREGIKKYSNWPTIPQLYIDGKFIGGCDITIELYENGDLKKMV